jgi:hypothetical protein
VPRRIVGREARGVYLLKAFESFDRQKVNQFAKLDRQDFAIPTRLLRNLVVSDDVGPLLGVGETIETDNWEGAKPSNFVLSTRPWSTRIIFTSSTRTGFRKLNFLRPAAIRRRCLFECVRAFRGLARRVLIGAHSTFSGPDEVERPVGQPPAFAMSIVVSMTESVMVMISRVDPRTPKHQLPYSAK